MDFVELLNSWQKGELLQAKIMIGSGALVLLVFVAIWRAESVFLKGMMLPLALLLVVLTAYGGYILHSRPNHVAQSIAAYQSEPENAVKDEIQKHRDDNKLGHTLLKIYPLLVILMMLGVWLLPSAFYRGMAIGFGFLFLSTYVIDTGFVSRSAVVLQALR